MESVEQKYQQFKVPLLQDTTSGPDFHTQPLIVTFEAPLENTGGGTQPVRRSKRLGTTACLRKNPLSEGGSQTWCSPNRYTQDDQLGTNSNFIKTSVNRSDAADVGEAQDNNYRSRARQLTAFVPEGIRQGLSRLPTLVHIPNAPIYGEKTIGQFGSFIYLVNQTFGAGILALPYVLKVSGWFPSFLANLLVCGVAMFGTLMIMRCMTMISGNQNFEKRVEYITTVEYFLGKRYRFWTELCFYISIQSLNIVSIAVVSQSLDHLLLRSIGMTSGLVVDPGKRSVSFRSFSTQHDVDHIYSGGEGLIFGVTLGYIINALICIPLSSQNMDENMKIQYVSFTFLVTSVLQISTAAALRIMKQTNVNLLGALSTDYQFNNLNITDRLISNTASYDSLYISGLNNTLFTAAAIKDSINPITYGKGVAYPKVQAPRMFGLLQYEQLLSTFIASYSYVNVIPSWANEMTPGVKVNIAVWSSSAFACIVYYSFGFLLAFAYPTVHTDNILQELLADDLSTGPFTKFSIYIFNLFTVLPGILVYSITTRYNLVNSGVASPKNSFILGCIVPFTFAWLLANDSYFSAVLQWSSLIFSLAVNFIIPSVVYVTACSAQRLATRNPTRHFQTFNNYAARTRDGVETIMGDISEKLRVYLRSLPSTELDPHVRELLDQPSPSTLSRQDSLNESYRLGKKDAIPLKNKNDFSPHHFKHISLDLETPPIQTHSISLSDCGSLNSDHFLFLDKTHSIDNANNYLISNAQEHPIHLSSMCESHDNDHIHYVVSADHDNQLKHNVPDDVSTVSFTTKDILSHNESPIIFSNQFKDQPQIMTPIQHHLNLSTCSFELDKTKKAISVESVSPRTMVPHAASNPVFLTQPVESTYSNMSQTHSLDFTNDHPYYTNQSHLFSHYPTYPSASTNDSFLPKQKITESCCPIISPDKEETTQQLSLRSCRTTLPLKVQDSPMRISEPKRGVSMFEQDHPQMSQYSYEELQFNQHHVMPLELQTTLSPSHFLRRRQKSPPKHVRFNKGILENPISTNMSQSCPHDWDILFKPSTTAALPLLAATCSNNKDIVQTVYTDLTTGRTRHRSNSISSISSSLETFPFIHYPSPLQRTQSLFGYSTGSLLSREYSSDHTMLQQSQTLGPSSLSKYNSLLPHPVSSNFQSQRSFDLLCTLERCRPALSSYVSKRSRSSSSSSYFHFTKNNVSSDSVIILPTSIGTPGITITPSFEPAPCINPIDVSSNPLLRLVSLELGSQLDYVEKERQSSSVKEGELSDRVSSHGDYRNLSKHTSFCNLSENDILHNQPFDTDHVTKRLPTNLLLETMKYSQFNSTHPSDDSAIFKSPATFDAIIHPHDIKLTQHSVKGFSLDSQSTSYPYFVPNQLYRDGSSRNDIKSSQSYKRYDCPKKKFGTTRKTLFLAPPPVVLNELPVELPVDLMVTPVEGAEDAYECDEEPTTGDLKPIRIHVFPKGLLRTNHIITTRILMGLLVAFCILSAGSQLVVHILVKFGLISIPPNTTILCYSSTMISFFISIQHCIRSILYYNN